MIVTCKKEVPRRWIILSILPWASFTFNGGVTGTAFLFSLQKFIENPAALTFVLSLSGLFSLVISPIANFVSDRIWTPIGRRKPFVIVSWIGMVVAMVLMPVMPNFWLLIGAFMLFQFSSALNSPLEPLKQEIIPPQERGWATGAMAWCSNLATMAFYFIMLGRFDDVEYMAGVPISGELAIYWSAALFLAAFLLIIILGVRETDPKSSIRGERISVRTFLGGLLNRELWPVYLLVFGNACLNFYSGLGALSNLLYTVQWGYTKQEMGINVAIGGLGNVFIIGLLTVFADKLNRMRAYQTVLILSLLANVGYYFYVEYMLPDRRPTLVEIIVFGESVSILSILTGLLYVPLVYDYVRRNLMGTFGAGGSLVSTLTRLITLNGVGLFVTFYTHLFQPPAGEMTRVVLKQPVERHELLSSLRTAGLAPATLDVDNWAATGVIEPTGRTWEIRSHDPSSEALAKEKEALTAEKSPLVSRQAMSHGAGQYQVRIDEINRRVAEIDTELNARSHEFRDETTHVLDGRLIAEGDQILAAYEEPARELDFAVSSRPDPATMVKTLAALRAKIPGIIDLRPLKRDTGYGLAVSVTGTDSAPVIAQMHLIPIAQIPRTAVTLDLSLVEQPVDTYISPITRAADSVLGFFGHAPDPRHRLTALAHSLQSPTESNHVRVSPGPAPRSIQVTALLEPNAAADKVSDAISQRLATLSAPAQARAFYDRIQTAAAAQHLTIVHPILDAEYAPMRYDYMSGYLWMFVMGSIGITLTFVFTSLEARGIVRKRGVEEALAS